MSVTTLALDTIAVDAGTQVRSAINDDVVADYAERLAEGVTFPPVVVFHDSSQSYLADGFHRVLAAQRAGRDVIEAEVRPGTKTDALWYALGANRANGQRLTLADKQHAVRLARETWPDRSQGLIAEQIGCSQSFVSQVISAYDLPRPSRVTGKDGKSYPARRRPTSPQTQEQPVDRAPTDSARSKRPAAVAARRERIRTMAAAGHSIPQIAAAVGLNPDYVVQIAATHQIKIPARRVGRRQAIDSNRIVSTLVFDAEHLTTSTELIDYAALDRTQLRAWIHDLEVARLTLGKFIRRLRRCHDDETHGADSLDRDRQDARPEGGHGATPVQ